MLARHSGVVRIEEDEGGRRITVVADDGERGDRLGRRPRPPRGRPTARRSAAGDALVEGPKDPKELLEIKGIRETQQYLVEEVQKVYRDQGVSIHDKHIELIVRQMLRRVLVAEPGDAAVPARRAGRQPASTPRSTASWSRRASARPRAGPSSWASPRRRSPPTRGCRPPPSRRRPGCSPRRRSRASPTSCSGSRRTSSSAS